jgi:sarcosine oxidase subunit beta
MEKTDVLIIGAGIVGCSAAYFLSKTDADVILIDKTSIAREASGSTAGTMSYQNKERKLVHLTEEAMRIWSSYQEELEDDIEFRQTGGFRVAESKQQFEKLCESVKRQKQVGVELDLLSKDELAIHAPYLGPSVCGASYCKWDGRSNPLLSSPAIARSAESRGVRIHVNEPVKKIKIINKNSFVVSTSKSEYETSCILNSAGLWSKNIFRMIGIDYPITVDPQQVMVTEQSPEIFPHVITHIKGTMTLKQVDNGNVVIGGGWKGRGSAEENIKKVSYYNMHRNVQYACRVIPALKKLNLIRCWTGLEGRSPDFLPLLGNLNLLPGFYTACCSKGGYHLGPLWGKLLTEMILTGKSSIPLEEYDVNRFVHHLDKYFTEIKQYF